MSKDQAINKKLKQLKRLEEEAELLQRRIEVLRLIDDKETEIEAITQQETTAEASPQEAFPVGTPVKFTNPKEKPELRGKTGEVIGHSPKFVRVRRGKESYRRLPSNLTPQK